MFRLFPFFAIFALAVTQLAAQLTLIEENFDEATPGARLAAVEKGDLAAGIQPTYGKYGAFMLDEGEIVPGLSGEGQSLQMKDTLEGHSLRFLFSTTDVDPVTSGKIEASLDFRVDRESPLEKGTPFQVRLNAPTTGTFLVMILGDGGTIMHTNSNTPPAHRGMARGEPISLGVVYTLAITADLDTSTYTISIQEKERGQAGVLWKATDQQFIPIPNLESNGLGKSLLDIFAGSQGAEPPVTVTVDNILIRHLD